MFKKIAAVSCGVFLGILIAFARAGAFPFWSGGSQQDQAKSQSGHAKASQSPPAERAPQTEANGGPAPANQPEPNETGVAIPSFAPLVKRVMGSVVNVSVVQQVKAGFGDQGGPGDSPDAPDSPDGPGAGPGGPGGRRTRRTRRPGGTWRPVWSAAESLRSVPPFLRPDSPSIQAARTRLGRHRLPRRLYSDQQSRGRTCR